MNILRLVVLFLLCFHTVSGAAMNRTDEGNIEVAMRLIGHELLLNSGDSTSRVLPVVKVGNRYEVSFDAAIDFDSGFLYNLVDSIFISNGISEKYRVEMVNLDTEEVIFSYFVDNETDSTMLPCRQRDQPMTNYNLVITLIDLPPVALETEDNVSASFGWFNVRTILPGILLIAMLVFFFRKRKSTEGTDDSNPDLIQLGSYVFNKRNMVLTREDESTELTSKEADLLVVLHSSVNNTIEREVILNSVWGDEGDYVGRTLDVFVSKLRKKLSADPNIKITNIRGVGYRLILND